MTPPPPFHSAKLADQLMAIDVFSELLAATAPQQLGRRLTEQLRELTGAQTVMLLKHPAANAPHTLLQVSPERRAEPFSTEELGLFCPECTPGPLPPLTTHLPPGHPLRVVLERTAVDSLLRVPLRARGEIVSTLLLLNLPEPDRINEVATVVAHLAPVIALALKNAFAQERISQQALALENQTRELEHRVTERTAALEEANRSLAASRLAALNLMEDAVAARERIEQANAALQREITERERAEVNLRESEARLTQAMEMAHLAQWEFDAASASLLFNDRFYALYGTTAEREGGYRMPAEVYAREFLLPEERYLVRDEILRALDVATTETTWRIEHRIRRRDGAIRHISIQIIVVKDSTGRTIGTRGASQDITDRKLAEQALQHSEALFRRTFDEAPVGSAIVQLDSTILRVNAALCHFLGYTAEELKGKSVTEVTHPDDVVDSVAQIRRLLSGEVSAFEFEKRYLRKGGAVVWGRVSVSLMRDSDGEPLHLAPIVEDITARKQAEAELRQTRAILQVAMDQSPAGIAIADAPSGALRYVNDAGLLIRGGDRAGIVNGVGLEQYVASWKLFELDGRPLRTDEVPLARAVLFGESCSREFMIHRGDADNRVVLAKAAPIKDEAGTVVAAVVVFLDVTEQKRAERDLEQFFNLVPDMVCIASADGFFRKLNDEWVRALGYSKDELMAVPYTEFIDPEDRAATHHESVQQASGNTTNSFVNRYRAKDGTYRWLEWNATSITESGLFFAAARDITKHRQAEAAVHESELRYRTLANSGPGLVWTSGLDKKCDYFNQTWLAFTGRTLDQELGDGWVEGVHPEDLSRCVTTYVTAFDRHEHFSMDYRLRNHAGEYRWIQDDGSPRHDSQGNFLGYIGHCLDITERKRAEEVIAWEAALVENSADLCCVKDLDLRVRAVNSAFVRAARASSAAEVLGKTDAEFLGWPGNEANVQSYLADERRAQTLAPGESILREEQAMQPDGSMGLLLTRKFPVFDPAGRLIATASISTDITERKRAEEERRRSHELLAKLTAQVPGVVYQYRLFPDGRSCFPYSSPGMQSIYEYEPEEVREDASPVYNRLHPEDAGAVAAAILESARTLAPFHCEFRVVLPRQGLRWRLSDAMPERTEDGATLWYGIISDITERKRAEAALLESLHEKEALLKEVHHRVKNNLQVISSLLRLESGRVADLGTQSVLRDMQNRIRTMALLHESLYRSGNLAEVDMKAYLETLCQQFFRAASARSSGPVELEMTVAPMRIELNRTVPCGLIVNELVSNCLKHAFPEGRGGRVRVDLQPTTVPDEWGLSVSDDGVGLPAGFTLESLPSLGLQLVSDLSRQLQGRLAIGTNLPRTPAANPGPGASFTVYFKALPPESRPSP